jgi:hypothetical protein
MDSLLIFGISLFAGFLGSILGIGGGAVLIPALTLGFGIHIRYAVGASLISVIATSSGAAASYVRDRLTNIRVAIFLEMATTLGALVGVMISGFLKSDRLYVIFGVVLFHSAYLMSRKRENDSGASSSPSQRRGIEDFWANRLRLNSSYPDGRTRREVEYQVSHVPLGFLYMIMAGVLSGLLGIGSGILKVLAMDRAMGLPIKVSSATSNFMIGVTAAASAGVYFLRGDVIPELAGPVALGVLVGSTVGARLMPILPAQQIRRLFVVVIAGVAVQMILKGLR